MTRADDIRAASTMNGKRSESRRRPMPRRASVTDERADRSTSDFRDMGPGVGSIIGQLTGPTDGLRGRLSDVRAADSCRVARGVHGDVDNHTSCATCTDPGEGEQLLDVSADPRLQPGGAAEQEFSARTARHRAGTWPREQPEPVDRARLRYGA